MSGVESDTSVLTFSFSLSFSFAYWLIPRVIWTYKSIADDNDKMNPIII
jgi:hypothetical protein